MGNRGEIQDRVIIGQSAEGGGAGGSLGDCAGSILMWPEHSHFLCVDAARESFENTCMAK